MANIEAGSDKQLIIRDLVESYGLKISSKTAPGHICAVATLESIYDRYGYHVLDRVLRFMVGTWEGVTQSLSANMLNGLARLVFAYGDNLKEEMFKDKLSRVSIKELVRAANERRAGSLGFAEAMLIFYNKKTHATALEWNVLYTTKVGKGRIDQEGIRADKDELEDETEMNAGEQMNMFTTANS